MFSANRLEFASNMTKLNVRSRSSTVASGAAIRLPTFQSAHYEGERRVRHVIRGEYIDLALISEHLRLEQAT